MKFLLLGFFVLLMLFAAAMVVGLLCIGMRSPAKNSRLPARAEWF